MSAPHLLGRAQIQRILVEHGLSASKALGQNFVADPNTVERIARLSGVGSGDHVLEIGAGLGSLTLALAATGATVVALEVDRYLVPVLRAIVPAQVRVIEADALECDFAALLGEAEVDYVLVANLPYNVATPVVMNMLERVPQVKRMVVMVQREVAERLAASPGSRTFSGVTVRLRYFAHARIVGHVSREVFVPRPNVSSSLVEIVRNERPAVDPAMASYEEIAELVRAGFRGRRKMLRRSLEGLVTAEGFAVADIDPTQRAETVDIVGWGRLAGWRRLQQSLPTRS